MERLCLVQTTSIEPVKCLDFGKLWTLCPHFFFQDVLIEVSI